MIIADLLATLSISDQKQWISDNLTKLYDGNYKQRLEIAHVLSWLSPNVTADILESVKDRAFVELTSEVAVLLADIDSVQLYLDERCKHLFQKYIQRYQLIREFQGFSALNQVPLVDSIEYNNDEDSMEAKVIECLDYLYKQNPSIDMQLELCLLHGSSNMQIATNANRLLRTVARYDSNLWNCIRALLTCNVERSTLGYKLWIKCMDHNACERMKSSDYWKSLQQGISSDSYDQKKYALYILSQSIRAINFDINNDYIQWNVSNSMSLLSEWKRYISLIEIICIDTSINQTIDTSNDMLNILTNPSSLIPHTWSMCLLSTGLKSPMESIKDHINGVIISLNNLDFLQQGDELFIEQILLPQATTAAYFNAADMKKCSYGDMLSEFVYKLICNSKLKTIPALLSFLNSNRTSYDVPKIYILHGINRAITNLNVTLSVDDLKSVEGLVTSTLSSNLRELAFMFLCTSILLNARADDANEWLRIVEHFLNPQIINLLAAKIVQYLLDNGIDFKDYNVSPQYKLELLLCYDKNMAAEYFMNEEMSNKCKVVLNCLPNTEKFLMDMDSMFIEQVKGKVGSNPKDSLIYSEVLQKLDSKLSDPGVDVESLTELLVGANLDDLANIFAALSVSPSSILTNPLSLIEKASQQNRTARELAFTQAYKLLTHDKVPLTSSRVTQLSETFMTVGYECRMSILKYLQMALDLGLESGIGSVLGQAFEDMWNALVEERLIANQRPLHLAFIDVAFHKIILQLDDGGCDISEIVELLANKIIEQSYARRSLLPKLAQCLQHGTNLWIGRVFTNMYCFFQNTDSLFTSDRIINSLLNATVSDMLSITYDAYEFVYGDEEISAKVIAISWLSKFTEHADQLYDYIFNSHDNLLKPVKRADHIEEQKRTALFQILLVLESRIINLEKILETFVVMIDTESSILVRTYVEWICSRMILRLNLVSKLVLTPLGSSENQPRILSSLMRMGIMIAQASKSKELYRDYTLKLVPLATSNRAAVRHMAVSLIYALSVDDYFLLLASLDVKQLIENATSNLTLSDSFQLFRRGDRTIWSLDKDYTLVGICGGVLQRVSDRSALVITQQQFKTYVPNFKLSIEVGKDEDEVWKRLLTESIDKQPKAKESNIIQTKSGAWNTVIRSDETKQVQRGQLIVIASLVDKAPNLGGICRLCDVLGAELLCLDDMQVTSHPHFKSVAVTAENWMPMHQVEIGDIIPYMVEKKNEGYTLIGLEQTDSSVQLETGFQFPRKSVLLLGREKYGIPGNMLAELDYCVEIKQVGVVRSMNIQTATAVVVHAYSSQHC